MPDQTQDRRGRETAAGAAGAAPAGTDERSAVPALPWARAWQEALYGKRGFYRRAAPAAHFATSAQGLPGGGEVLAEAVLALARRHGCRAVVDVGAGRGELLGRVRALAPDLHLTGVDVVGRPAGLEVDRWLVSPGGAALPDGLTGVDDALVLAHEWLDVVPCPVVERVGPGPTDWREVAVRADGTELPGPPVCGKDLAWARRWLGPGVDRAEVGRPRDEAFGDLLSRVRSGLVVVVDYGHTASDRPPHGTLTGFRDGRQVEPVPDGCCDLTAHVAVDSLADVATSRTAVRHEGSAGVATTTCEVTTQRDLLVRLVGDPAQPVPHALASADPTSYLAALSRRAALGALTAPGGLGDFRWVLTAVGPPRA